MTRANIRDAVSAAIDYELGISSSNANQYLIRQGQQLQEQFANRGIVRNTAETVSMRSSRSYQTSRNRSNILHNDRHAFTPRTFKERSRDFSDVLKGNKMSTAARTALKSNNASHASRVTSSSIGSRNRTLGIR